MYGFCQVLYFNVFAACQIGYGAAHFQYAVIRTCTQIQAGHGGFQQCLPCLIDFAHLQYFVAGQLRIAVHTIPILVSVLLQKSGIYNPFAHISAAFVVSGSGCEFIKTYRRYFYMYVNSIQQRTAYFAQIPVYNTRCAYTISFRMVVIPAGARV